MSWSWTKDGQAVTSSDQYWVSQLLCVSAPSPESPERDPLVHVQEVLWLTDTEPSDEGLYCCRKGAESQSQCHYLEVLSERNNFISI